MSTEFCKIIQNTVTRTYQLMQTGFQDVTLRLERILFFLVVPSFQAAMVVVSNEYNTLQPTGMMNQ
jgi:hypothetical protein